MQIAGPGSPSLAALPSPHVSRQTWAVAAGHWGAGGSCAAGPGHLLPITCGSFGKGFGARPSPGCFLPATRKKLFELARAFSEKTKMRKSKRKHLLKHQVYPKRGWGAAGGCRALGLASLRCSQGLPEATGLNGASWLPLTAVLWAGKGDCGTAATSQLHDWFSLVEGTDWARQLPQQIFSTMSKDIRAVSSDVCAACRDLQLGCAAPRDAWPGVGAQSW